MMPFLTAKLAACCALLAASACAAGPEQIHIAYAGEDGTGMTISWSSSDSSAPEVKWGTSAASLTHTSQGSSKSYMKPLTHHHATLTGLTPSTKYYYQVTGGEAVMSFTTAPEAGDAGQFSASVFGDWGYGKNGHATATYSALNSIKNEVEFVWHLGDIGYADDAFLHPLGPNYEGVYNDWMNWIQNISSETPYMVAVGNHESECHSPQCIAQDELKEALKNFTAYNARWKMPFTESGGTSNMWYSYDYGLAHFISLDTETDFPGAGEENHGDSGVIPAGHFGRDGEYIEWLEADLAKANASRHLRPWIFAGGHRPLYTSAGEDRGGQLNKAVEDLFHTYHVDVYFAGHEHSYARSLPVYKKQPEADQNKQHYINPKYTSHVLVGGAGCDEMHAHGEASTSAEVGLQNVYPPVPLQQNASVEKGSWNVYDDIYYGTGILTVYNATTMSWRYIHSATMDVKDEFYITKD